MPGVAALAAFQRKSRPVGCIKISASASVFINEN